MNSNWIFCVCQYCLVKPVSRELRLVLWLEMYNISCLLIGSLWIPHFLYKRLYERLIISFGSSYSPRPLVISISSPATFAGSAYLYSTESTQNGIKKKTLNHTRNHTNKYHFKKHLSAGVLHKIQDCTNTITVKPLTQLEPVVNILSGFISVKQFPHVERVEVNLETSHMNVAECVGQVLKYWRAPP